MMKNTVDVDNEYILAIDPALSTTGYAIINTDTMDLVYINKFTTSSNNPDTFRINEIVKKLFAMASMYNIKDIVLEDGFLGKNPRTCIQLATLRGAIIGAFMLCKYNIEMMMPSEIRQQFGVGGSAKKEEVAQAVSDMYQGNKKLAIVGPYSDKQNKNKTSDIYDAISIGVAYLKKKKSRGATDGK